VKGTSDLMPAYNPYNLLYAAPSHMMGQQHVDVIKLTAALATALPRPHTILC
jgi:hypothetical protein